MEVCLYNDAPATYLERRLDGRSTIERAVAWAASLEGLVEPNEGVRVTLYSTADVPGLPGTWTVQRCGSLTEADLTHLIATLTGTAETEIVFAFFDQPFLNAELTERMITRHRSYRAEYTIADGYPAGLSPEIVSGHAVAHLASLASDTSLIDRRGLFPIVQKDINRLDVETELSAIDQRLMRLHLSVDTAANLKLCENLAPGAPSAIDEWAAHAETRREQHRTLPRFVSIQVIEQEVQRLAYSPYPAMREDVLAPGRVMGLSRFEDLVDRIDAFSPEAVVHLSLWGEIALHPDAIGLFRAVLSRPRLRLLVETSGVGWESARADELFALDSRRFTLIVGLDSNDPERYERVRGDGFHEAQSFARAAVDRLGDRAFVQAVRSDLTEPSLDAFYREWHELTPNVIIEKYDDFCGTLPGRKIGDISPLDRFPCWHLERDLYVLVDGRVPLCREDLDASHPLGNVFTDGMSPVWEAGAPRFAEHVRGEWRGICEQCDEYYTFNF